MSMRRRANFAPANQFDKECGGGVIDFGREGTGTPTYKEGTNETTPMNAQMKQIKPVASKNDTVKLDDEESV